MLSHTHSLFTPNPGVFYSLWLFEKMWWKNSQNEWIWVILFDNVVLSFLYLLCAKMCYYTLMPGALDICLNRNGLFNKFPAFTKYIQCSKIWTQNEETIFTTFGAFSTCKSISKAPLNCSVSQKYNFPNNHIYKIQRERKKKKEGLGDWMPRLGTRPKIPQKMGRWSSQVGNWVRLWELSVQRSCWDSPMRLVVVTSLGLTK